MPKSAERRPARDDFPPRRMRATVPAHSKPECKGAVLLEFDSLINQTPMSENMSSTAGTRSTTPLCREEPESRSARCALLAPANRKFRGAHHRAGLLDWATEAAASSRRLAPHEPAAPRPSPNQSSRPSFIGNPASRA